MVEVQAFKGITYNKKKITKLDDVMSPPYDIISEKLQDELYNKHPKNFVRLIINKLKEDDNDINNRYTRAKKLYYEWLKDTTLIQSDKPAIYPYKIEYNIENQKKTMNGFFILLKIDPEYKLIKAHERTLSKPKADRLNLMRSCNANLEPIQLLYIDEEDDIHNTIQKSLSPKALIDVTGYDGFNHAIWKITDKSVITQIKNFLDDEILFIADGHHRYQTAINFAKEMEEKTGDSNPDAPFQYRMVILANMFDEGLAILPTHRLLNLPDTINKEKLQSVLKQYFTVEVYHRDSSIKPQKLAENIKKQIETDKQHKFALFFKDNYFIITLKDESIMDKLANERSETWKKLDVSILHKIVIEEIMGITQDNLEDHVKYTREDEEAITVVDNGSFDCSILMNATKIDELKAIADAEEHMPQKSTYFLPKMLSGLVMYDMKLHE